MQPTSYSIMLLIKTNSAVNFFLLKNVLSFIKFSTACVNAELIILKLLHGSKSKK